MVLEIFDVLFVPSPVSGSLLDTEHALVMLFMLYGMLSYQGDGLKRWAPVGVMVGIVLSLVTTVHQINFFWPVITALVVPPYVWQAAIEIAKRDRQRSYLELGIWGIILALVVTSLWFFSGLPFSHALLLGFLAASLIWHWRETKTERTYLSALGQVALAVLLVEVDLTVVSLRYWFGILFSGAALGIGFGLLGIYIYRRLKQGRFQQVFFMIWAYLSYMLGYLFETSGIAATLATALIVAAYGYSIGLWRSAKQIPLLTNSSLLFSVVMGFWLLLGWQAHTYIVPGSLWGIVVAVFVIGIGILLARKVAPIELTKPGLRLFRKELRVVLLLFGAVLFWPEQAFVSTVNVEIAIIAAFLLIFTLRQVAEPLFEFLGVPLSWPLERVQRDK